MSENVEKLTMNDNEQLMMSDEQPAMSDCCEEEDVCVICNEEIKSLGKVKQNFKDAKVISPCCGIALHLSCALKWKLKQNECPYRCCSPWPLPAVDVDGFIHCPICERLGFFFLFFFLFSLFLIFSLFSFFSFFSFLFFSFLFFLFLFLFFFFFSFSFSRLCADENESLSNSEDSFKTHTIFRG